VTASAHPDHPGSPRELPHRTATDAPGTEGSPDPGPVVVPESARFEGLLTYRGRAQVDGEVEGEILCRGTLRVGEHGRVIGTIEADELIVAGVLEGEATARRRLELTATARVRGTIRSPLLQFADGCCVEGRCETGPPSVPEDT
jgi:cytoskeletal protein CcmA (bactofilin family)